MEGSYFQDQGFNDFKFDHGYLYIDVSYVEHRSAPVPTRPSAHRSTILKRKLGVAPNNQGGPNLYAEWP